MWFIVAHSRHHFRTPRGACLYGRAGKVVVEAAAMYESMGVGMKNTALRWQRVKRAMRMEDQVYAERLAAMIAAHARDRFTVFEDPLEAALFSVLIELMKEIDRKRDHHAVPGEWAGSGITPERSER
ncbi:MAG: hypothetical protein LUO82_03330 [Methanomicrobiales archaeon]|nr:hypothetical protein [Methanomicrobiales archaeon]